MNTSCKECGEEVSRKTVLQILQYGKGVQKLCPKCKRKRTRQLREIRKLVEEKNIPPLELLNMIKEARSQEG